MVQDPIHEDEHHPQVRGLDANFTGQRFPTKTSPVKTLIIPRRPDQRMEESDLLTLFKTLDLNIIMKLFGSLLLERKVILLSKALK